MSRQALALGLVATLVLSTLFFSPVYKAEEDEEFYDNEPFLHYELHIYEMDIKNQDENETREFEGSVYMRREYSAQESEKFRGLLITSYKIFLLDQEYRGNVNSVLMSVSEGTKDATTVSYTHLTLPTKRIV